MPDLPTREATLARARSVLRIEADAIAALTDTLDERFTLALDLLAACRGRVIVTGMGKSGIIARKIAATLSSTGTPAYFLHPAEAVHGDLGVVQADDLLLALSNSGETPEILRLLETIRRIGARLIAITGRTASTLAQTADVALECRVAAEACPMNLVPTASTTASLALGDALAMALLVRKGFSEEHFATLHPGGELGKRLLRVSQVMHVGADVAKVAPTALLADVAAAVSAGGLGMACVVDDSDALLGVVTDGDLRRQLTRPANLARRTAAKVMTASPHTIAGDALAVEALRLMEQHRITSVVVTDAGRRVAGVVHLHDLWRTELF